jgi:hypothetical protein
VLLYFEKFAKKNGLPLAAIEPRRQYGCLGTPLVSRLPSGLAAGLAWWAEINDDLTGMTMLSRMAHSRN